MVTTREVVLQVHNHKRDRRITAAWCSHTKSDVSTRYQLFKEEKIIRMNLSLSVLIHLKRNGEREKKLTEVRRCTLTVERNRTPRAFFFFFFENLDRLSARISDFENILLMVHVGGVHACAAGARYATFFFTNARF